MKSFKIGKIDFCVNNIIDPEHLSILAPEKAYIIKNFKKIFDVKPGSEIYYMDNFSYSFDYIKLFDVYVSTGIVEDPLYNSADYNLSAYLYKKSNGFMIVSGYYIGGGDERIRINMAFFVFDKSTNYMEKIKKLLVQSVGDSNDLRKAQREKKRNEQRNCIKRVFLEGSVLHDIIDDIDLFIKNEKKYKELGLPWKRGYLFYGPPGNGKTLTIKTIAKYFGLCAHNALNSVDNRGNINLPIAHDDDLVIKDECSAAIVERLIHELFPTDRLPSFYYLEDLEKIVSYQSKDSDNPVLTLSSLLRALDGVRPIDGVIFVGTTNNISCLAESVIARPGRFDRVIEFKRPSPEQIEKMLTFHKIKVSGVEKEELAGWFKGMSFTFVEEFIKMAKFESMKNVISKSIADKLIKHIREHNKMRQDLKEGVVGFGV